jgi:D-glycero-D-manno-heptose 1,7-bisphosphate phosphatase
VSSALFLDRDGVINEKAPEGHYVTSAARFHMLPGVPQAIAELRARLPDVRIVVVTNQRGVARGEISREALDEIHLAMRTELRAAGGDVDAIEVCPHEIGVCDCRKPGLGLFLRAIEQFPDIDTAASVVVGDSTADLEAGFHLGARTCLVGEAGRRARVRREAAERQVRIDLEGASLPELVAGGTLVDWLSQGTDAGRGARTGVPLAAAAEIMQVPTRVSLPGVGTVVTSIAVVGTPDGETATASLPGPGGASAPGGPGAPGGSHR